MRNVKKQVKKAFTLIEILIVVVILGILAAIVVPQFTSATQDSQGGNIKSQVGTLQRQIELYYAKTNTWPTFTGADSTAQWSQLVTGNYIKAAPANPAWPSPTADEARRVSPGTVFGSASTGWVWHTGNNQLYASYFMDNPASNTNTNFGKVYTGAFTAGNE